MIEITEFKGNPIIKLMKDEEDKFGFNFGLSKAKLILDNIEEIKKFVEEHGSG